MKDLEHYKQLARQANAVGDYQTVGMILWLRLEPLFGDDLKGAVALCRELEQETPTPYYNPMQED
jgi:hypothetical protein